MSYNTGAENYGNDKNNYNGRYQALQVQWATASDATAATPDTTTVVFEPNGRQIAAPLDILVHYPAASGAVSTPAQLWVYILRVNNGTPERIGTIVIATEASQSIRTTREFSLATLTAGSATGTDRYTYQALQLGDTVQLLYKVAGIGGTQTAIRFGLRTRERQASDSGPTVATAGNIADKTWG